MINLYSNIHYIHFDWLRPNFRSIIRLLRINADHIVYLMVNQVDDYFNRPLLDLG